MKLLSRWAFPSNISIPAALENYDDSLLALCAMSYSISRSYLLYQG